MEQTIGDINQECVSKKNLQNAGTKIGFVQIMRRTKMRLIDADALIDAIKNTLWDWDSVDGIMSSIVLKQTISDINNMPTIDAEFDSLDDRKQSRWYGEGDGYADGNFVYDTWSCGECGHVFDEWDEEPDWNYCPMCGSKMRL